VAFSEEKRQQRAAEKKAKQSVKFVLPYNHVSLITYAHDLTDIGLLVDAVATLRT